MKKKAPDLQQVNHAVLQVVHPEHVTVEICRSEELDQRRGLTSELDEIKFISIYVLYCAFKNRRYPLWPVYSLPMRSLARRSFWI